MKKIDIASWNRSGLYTLFRGVEFPHFSATTEVDVTALQAFAKANHLSFYRLCLYLVCRAANECRAFRLRLVPDGVVEHERVGIAPTVTICGVVNFLVVDYYENPAEFILRYNEQEERVREMGTKLNLEDDGMPSVYSSCVPWYHLTGAVNPMCSKEDSIPRFTWGKYVPREGRLIMGMAVQCHHALVDGADVAAFLSCFQRLADTPEQTFAALLAEELL